jgi:ADP-heptose:LPS heptosyltransferase
MYAKLFAFLPKKKKIIVCLDDRLINLFERSFSKLTFIKQSTYQKDLDSTKSLAFDYQIPIGSLAKLYLPSYNILNNLEDFYLFSDKEKTNSIRKKLKKNNELIIGISWRTTNKESSKERNIPLSLLAQGLNHKQIKLVNLQYGDVSSEISLLKKNDKISVTQVDSIDIYNDIDSFSSLIDSCDLVVSIDNSTVHLAGSLGKKTFVLLPKVSDWRWMLKENFTPWYKSLKLFRQDTDNNWTEVMNKISDEVRK